MSHMEVPIDDLGLTVKLKQIGMADTVPVCRIVEVPEDAEVLKSFLGKEVNLDELNFLIRRLEGLDDYQHKLFRLCSNKHILLTIEKIINLTYSLQGLSFITDFSDPEAVGKKLVMDEIGSLADYEEGKFAYVAFAAECFMENVYRVLPDGVYVEHGFEFMEVYNGKTFPEIKDDIGMSVATVTLCNTDGEEEYLYLPTTLYSLNKVKERLGVRSFSECRVAGMENYLLPKNIIPDITEISNITALEKFNELCEYLSQFDPFHMRSFEMISNYMGKQDFSTMTCIAKHLHEFEVIPEVLSDEEYGRYMIFKTDMQQPDERLVAHINYESFAREEREKNFVQSGFDEYGFIGCRNDMEMYKEYKGAYREPLEINEEECITIRLYSPLYAQQYIEGEYVGNMEGDELTYYAEDIMRLIEERTDIDEEFRGLMIYMNRDMAVAEKVISAFPKVERIGKTLYGVLECKCRAALNEYEMSVLKDYWTGQMSDGWGEGFEQQEIRIDDGEILVSFYNSGSDWCVMTEEEQEIMHRPKPEMIM